MPLIQTLRRLIAPQVGSFGVFTATAGSTSSATCVAAFKSTELTSGYLAYDWFFVPGATGVAQRRIKKDGVTTGTGVITFDDVLSTAVTNGTVFELLGRLPAGREPAGVGGSIIPGIHECINEALRRILIPRIATVTLVSGQQDYALSGIPGLDRPERLREIRVTNALGTAREAVPASRGDHQWEMREDTEGHTLHFRSPWTFSSGTHTLHVECSIPAFNRIRVAGNWGDSTVGLVNESDVCGSDENAISTVALAFCFKALRDNAFGADRVRYDALYRAQVIEARKVRGYDRSNDIDGSISQEVVA